jgi:hypothetical protein
LRLLLCQLLALLTSVSLHVGLSVALGAVHSSRNANALRGRPVILAASLNGPGTASIPDRPHGAPPAPPALNKSEPKPADVPVRTPAYAPESTAEMPIVPFVFPIDPHYFQAKELQEKPQILQDISPTLNLSLPGVAIQSVVLRLLINELGDVDKVEIDESGLTDEAERLVAQAFSKLKFYPGKLDDSFVKSQLKIEVTLENTPPVPAAGLDK